MLSRVRVLMLVVCFVAVGGFAGENRLPRERREITRPPSVVERLLAKFRRLTIGSNDTISWPKP